MIPGGIHILLPMRSAKEHQLSIVITFRIRRLRSVIVGGQEFYDTISCRLGTKAIAVFGLCLLWQK